MRYLTLALLALLVGCAPRIQTEYVRVDVPVPVHRTAPEWLSQPYVPEQLPIFKATGIACLSEDGINHLKTILRTQAARDEAWRVWSENE